MTAEIKNLREPADLISQALELRSHNRYALHPVEAVVQYYCIHAEITGEESHGGLHFEQAEAHYRAGAQGLRLPEIPQLPQQLRELSRLASVERAGRKTLRKWVEELGHVINEAEFFRQWQAQGKRGGAEHQVKRHGHGFVMDGSCCGVVFFFFAHGSCQRGVAAFNRRACLYLSKICLMM